MIRVRVEIAPRLGQVVPAASDVSPITKLLSAAMAWPKAVVVVRPASSGSVTSRR